MRKIDIDELKDIQLQILNQISNFCEEEGINYWLDCGTLLGAVRHRGYIPWDDDIDIGMLRDDYENFISKFNKKNDKYRCCTMYNTNNFPFAFAKVMDLDTELYEPNKKEGVKMCINVDVFVYDNAPADQELLNKMYKKRDENLIWYRRRILPGWTTGSTFKRILKILLCSILKILPKQYFIDKIQKNLTKYRFIDTKFIGNFTSDTKILCNKEIFKSFVNVEFEGKLYKAPIGYDKWLKSFYGDYMQLPPKKQRVSKHKFEAYVKN